MSLGIQATEWVLRRVQLPPSVLPPAEIGTALNIGDVMFAVEFIGNSGLPERKEFDSRDQAIGYANSLNHNARLLNRCIIDNENWELPLYGYRGY